MRPHRPLAVATGQGQRRGPAVAQRADGDRASRTRLAGLEMHTRPHRKLGARQRCWPRHRLDDKQNEDHHDELPPQSAGHPTSRLDARRRAERPGIALGLLIGGAFVWLFAGIAVAANLIGYFCSDWIPSRALRAQPLAEGEPAETYPITRELAASRRRVHSGSGPSGSRPVAARTHGRLLCSRRRSAGARWLWRFGQQAHKLDHPAPALGRAMETLARACPDYEFENWSHRQPRRREQGRSSPGGAPAP